MYPDGFPVLCFQGWLAGWVLIKELPLVRPLKQMAAPKTN